MPEFSYSDSLGGEAADSLVPEGPSEITANISAVGDLMCSYRQFGLAREKGRNNYDFFPCYQPVRPLLAGADLTLGNLETTLAGASQSYRGFPRFNTPDDYIRPLKEAGFDVLFTSNNHSMDTGEDGIRRTIRVLDKNGIGHTGTFSSPRDRDSVRIMNVNGIRLALLSYTSTTNDIPVPRDKRYLVNYVDFKRMKREITRARAQGAELVMTYFHFGTQYDDDPNYWQEYVVKHTINAGADIIIGSHPHVVQPARFFKTKNARLDSGIVCFSLGNFLSNEFRRYADAGIIVNFQLTKNLKKDSIFISSVDYVPTWVYRGTHKKMKRHVIFPAEWGFSDMDIPYLTHADRARMREAFHDTRRTFSRWTDRVKVRRMVPDPGGALGKDFKIRREGEARGI